MDSSATVPLARFHALKSALLEAEHTTSAATPSVTEIEQAVGALTVSLGLLVDLTDGLRRQLSSSSPIDEGHGRDLTDAEENLDRVVEYLRGAASGAQIAHVRLQDDSKPSAKFIVE